MNEKPRLHRKDPARTAPLRNFSGIFRPDSSDHPAESHAPNGAADSSAQAIHDEPVGLAYRVIEKHIKEGKQHAGLFNGQPYQTRAMTDGFQELLERTIRFQNEMLPLFIDALTSAVKMAPIRTPEAAPSAPPPRGSEPRADEDSTAISIEVASSRPVQISIDLKENSEKLPLVTLGLRAVDPAAPVLSDVTFVAETAEHPLQLRVAIADDFPIGLYSGVVVHQVTGEVRGTLTVRIAK